MILKSLFNILGFQISWWACILGASNGIPYIGPIVMSLFLIIHFIFISKNLQELKLIIIFALVGTFIDSGLIFFGILSYEGLYSLGIPIAPLWITAMWCGFSATINHSMKWLTNKWLITFLLGAFFGPAAYLTGEKFGAINFLTEVPNIAIILAFVWGGSIPLIYWVNNWLITSNE